MGWGHVVHPVSLIPLMCSLQQEGVVVYPVFLLSVSLPPQPTPMKQHILYHLYLYPTPQLFSQFSEHPHYPQY